MTNKHAARLELRHLQRRVFREFARPPSGALLEAPHHLRQPRRVALRLLLRGTGQALRVGGAQLERRLDLMAHVVVHELEHEQRGLARGQPELLADRADALLVDACIAFERSQREARPLQGGEP